MVKNYIQSDSFFISEVVIFAKKNLDIDFDRYGIYSIAFYKESNKTNEKYAENPSDIIEWHGSDLICTIEWRKGILGDIYLYQKGSLKEIRKVF